MEIKEVCYYKPKHLLYHCVLYVQFPTEVFVLSVRNLQARRQLNWNGGGGVWIASINCCQNCCQIKLRL